MKGDEKQDLFDADLIDEIDWKLKKANFRDGVSPKNPGENLRLRPLNLRDYEKGFLKLLGQLTKVGDVSQTHFEDQFKAMRSMGNTYYTVVIEDEAATRIIGAGTVVIEQKFIHSCGQRGRIEDIVVCENYQGKQLGKLLVETLTLLGRHLGCYKISLECKEERAKFYESFGYEKDGQYFMVQRYKD